MFNYLLDIDGLDDQWENRVHGFYYDNNHEKNRPTSVIMNHLDSCSVEVKNATDDFNEEQEHPPVMGGARHVRDMSFCYFWKKLTECLNILWTCGELVWPS